MPEPCHYGILACDFPMGYVLHAPDGNEYKVNQHGAWELHACVKCLMLDCGDACGKWLCVETSSNTPCEPNSEEFDGLRDGWLNAARVAIHDVDAVLPKRARGRPRKRPVPEAGSKSGASKKVLTRYNEYLRDNMHLYSTLPTRDRMKRLSEDWKKECAAFDEWVVAVLQEKEHHIKKFPLDKGRKDELWEQWEQWMALRQAPHGD